MRVCNQMNLIIVEFSLKKNRTDVQFKHDTRGLIKPKSSKSNDYK
jgi:hypothetical protein